MEQQLVIVRDAGVSAVRALHGEIHDQLRNRLPPAGATDLGDVQSQINGLRSHMEHTTATLRAEANAHSSNLIGMWQNTERVIAQRLDATNAV
eukprot:1568078-Pyramimonas_sp.AAC.1